MSPTRDRLRFALREAMAARDKVSVRALRSALSAIDNAAAVEASRGPSPESAHVTIVGLGAGDVARLVLDEQDVVAIVHGEVEEYLRLAAEYRRFGRDEAASALAAEAAVLARYLPPPARSAATPPPAG